MYRIYFHSGFKFRPAALTLVMCRVHNYLNKHFV